MTLPLGIGALIASCPILLVLILMIAFKQPAMRAMPIGWAVAAILAFAIWRMDAMWLLGATIKGFLMGIDILVVVFGAILLYFTMTVSGAMDTLTGAIRSLTQDCRLQAAIIWLFAAFIEGTAGFGTPAALCAPILLAVGFPPLVAICTTLVLNSTPVTFGCVGIPIWGGVGAALDTPEIVAELSTSGIGFPHWVDGMVGGWAATIHSIIGTFLPLLAIGFMCMWLGGKFRDVKPTIPALLVAGLCFTVPYFLIAHFVGPELPSIIGGIVGLGIFIAVLRTGVFTPEKIWQLEQKENKIGEERKYSLLHSAVPYLLVTGAILCTRLIEPASAFCQSQVSVPWLEMFGTKLGFTEKFLWNPGFIFIVVSLLCIAIFRMPGAQVHKAWSLAAKRLAPAAVALLFAVAMSQMMINSDHNLSGMNAMLIMLALAVALVIGRAFPILAPFIGVLGAYIAGSNTVSNILFSGFQYATAKALGISRTITVALQAVGGAAGIMISVHSVVAACAVVGIAGQEGSVIKKTLIPCIIYGAVAGIIGMIVILIVGKGIF